MNRWTLYVLLNCLFLLLACETEEDLQAQVQKLIDNRVQERVDIFISTSNKRCTERVLEEAVRIVDSILFLEARLAKDTILKPPRPSRPAAPELKNLTDTAPVAPLFPEGLPVDSIRRAPVKGKN